MAAAVIYPPLPPGFTLDGASAPQGMPPLPDGFTLDAQPSSGGSDTVQTDPLAQSFPNPDYARSQPVAHTGYAAQVARTMAGLGPDLMAPPQTSPLDFAKGAAETAITGIPGIPGDTEAFARLIMSPFGVSRQNILPTTNDIANYAFGAPANSTEAAGRSLGGFASPIIVAGIARGAGAAGNALGVTTPSLPPNVRAQYLLSRALGRDNVSPENAADAISQFGDKPISVMDVGGPATARLARTVNTLPGEGSQEVSNFLAERQADQSGRVLGDISANLAPGGDVYGQAKQLMTDRAAAAKPAYDAAFEGGSIAPLQDQLRDELIAATGKKGAIAAQMRQIEQNNPGALAARGAAGAATRAKYMDLNSQLQQAEADRQATLQMFQRAQSDVASNAPGAVWSPRLQQFLEQPEVQSGIQRGLKIQRLESVGTGQPFNPTEYGITGTDASGNAIVSNVPNMRLLDAGKRGLDAMIADNTDAVTGKVNDLGRALTIAKNGYVSELDRLNPLYKTARDAFGGPSQSLNALNDGRDFLSLAPEEITDRMANMGSADRQFYQMGASRALQDRINGMPDNADALARVYGNKTIRNQIRAVFGNDAAAQFAQATTPEKIATMTNRFVRGGSNSADKLADIADNPDGAEIAKDAALGFVSGGPHGAVTLPAVNYARAKISGFFNGMSPPVRAQLGNMLTSTGGAAINTLGSLSNPGQAARTVGNASVGDISAIANNPIIRAILLQRAALALAPQAPQPGP